VWRFLTHPIIALVLYTVVVVAWHIVPGWYNAAVRNDAVHYLQHASFAGTALLFWWNVIDPAPLRASMGYLLRMVYVLVAATAQSLLAAMLTMADKPFYDAYVDTRRIFSLSPLSDQELGGLIMWIPGQMLHLIVIGALFAVWAVQSERRQRELEERELAESGAQPSIRVVRDA
jgi:cytochrome c oxidase assembly factor CtaG